MYRLPASCIVFRNGFLVQISQVAHLIGLDMCGLVKSFNFFGKSLLKQSFYHLLIYWDFA